MYGLNLIFFFTPKFILNTLISYKQQFFLYINIKSHLKYQFFEKKKYIEIKL